MLAFMQIVFRFGFLIIATNGYFALSNFQFALLVLSTVCIAAAGYVINNIMDQENDAIAKPKSRIVGVTISESTAYNIYVTFNITGVGIGFYLSNVIERPSFASIFILTAALLYIYSTSLKQITIVGNLIIASLLSLSILILVFFDLIPATFEGNQEQMRTVFKVLLDYAIFAFIINFIREIVKDMEDLDGDTASGVKSLAVLIGISKVTKIVFFLTLLAIGLLLYYINEKLLLHDYILYYALFFIIGPLLYFALKIWSAKTKQELHHLSTVLKVILFFGIISIAITTYFSQNA
jgi:4-hydroxybenzoate polyprenyltransferase